MDESFPNESLVSNTSIEHQQPSTSTDQINANVSETIEDNSTVHMERQRFALSKQFRSDDHLLSHKNRYKHIQSRVKVYIDSVKVPNRRSSNASTTSTSATSNAGKFKRYSSMPETLDHTSPEGVMSDTLADESSADLLRDELRRSNEALAQKEHIIADLASNYTTAKAQLTEEIHERGRLERKIEAMRWEMSYQTEQHRASLIEAKKVSVSCPSYGNDKQLSSPTMAAKNDTTLKNGWLSYRSVGGSDENVPIECQEHQPRYRRDFSDTEDIIQLESSELQLVDETSDVSLSINRKKKTKAMRRVFRMCLPCVNQNTDSEPRLETYQAVDYERVPTK